MSPSSLIPSSRAASALLLAMAVATIGYVWNRPAEVRAAVERSGQKGAGKEPPAEGDSSKQKKPETLTIEPQPFVIDVSLEGTFESKEMSPISIDTKEWSNLKILEVAPAGSPIRKGAPLVKFDMRPINEAIEELQAEQSNAKLALELAEKNLTKSKEIKELELEELERNNKIAQENRDYFEKVGRMALEKELTQQVTQSENYLAYINEELHQLEKMYKADDLTEETEEIILRRARDDVAQSRFHLESVKRSRDHEIDFDIPRKESSLKNAATSAAYQLERAQKVTPVEIQGAQQKIDHQRREFQKKEKKLAGLLHDQEKLTCLSPVDGLVYYGRCVDGKWPQAAALSEKYVSEGSIQPREVFVTVVQPRPLILRAPISEKELRWIRPGLTGKAVPIAFPDDKLSVTVEDVTTVPDAHGKFWANMVFALGKDIEGIMPAMNSTIRFQVYTAPQAIVVPTGTLAQDAANEDLYYVYVIEKEGAPPEKRPVTLGNRSGNQVELTGGLKAGEMILKSNPDAKPAPSDKSS